MKTTPSRWLWAAAVLGALAGAAAGQATQPGTTGDELIYRQQYAREEFRRLVDDMLRVAQMLETSEPEAARAIAQAVEKAQASMVAEDMEAVIRQLEQGLVLAARDNQVEVVAKLEEILETLRSGTIDLSPRLRQIEQWKRQLERLDELTSRQRQREAQTRRMENADAMAREMAELGRQLEGIVREQRELRNRTGDLPRNRDGAAAALAGLRDDLAALARDQAALAAATAGLPIAQLPAAQQRQAELDERAKAIADRLNEMAQDPAAAAAGAQAEIGAAAEAAGLAAGDMAAASDALAQSDKAATARHQEQSGADLDAAGRAVDAALARLAAGTEAGEAAGTQAALAQRTDDLAENVRRAMQQAGEPSGQPGGAQQPGGQPGSAEAGASGQPGGSDAASQPGATSQPAAGSQPAGEAQPPDAARLDRAADAMDRATRALNAQDPDAAGEAQDEALTEMERDLAELGRLQRRLEEMARRPDLEGERQAQDEVQASTEELADEMRQDPSGSPTPGQRSTEAAAGSMGQASQSLGQGKPGEANQQQREAVEQLELAREELAREIAQAEEMLQADALKRMDAMLRAMLNAQLGINRRTAAAYGKRSPDGYQRSEQLELSELADGQGRQAEEVGRIVAMIREENTTVVFPSVLEQVQQDMASVQKMLGEQQAGPVCQGVQEQVASVLRELIDALQQEMARREQQPGGQQGGGGGGQQRQPLVPPVAELRMLRSLQAQIRDRTVVLDTQAQAGTGEESAVRMQHRLLSDRQARLQDLAGALAERMRQARQEPPTAPQ